MDPIFLVGAERSGTTVFRLMLDHHPKIAVCSEFEYIVDPLVGCEEWPNLDEFHRKLEANWIFKDHKFLIDPSLSYPELARSFLEQTLRRKNGQYGVAVVHRNFDQIQRIWPNARYIHIVRDPRDVARSVMGMGWAGNVWHGVRFWVEAEQMWSRMKPQLSPDRFIEIKYEDLICSTEAVLTKVCQFIGTEFHPRMLDYPAFTTYTKPDPKHIAQWQHKLRPWEAALVEARVGSLLHQCGYQPSSHTIAYPSVFQQLWLKIDDKLGCLKYRIKQLGFWLFLSEYLSRKLNIKPLQEMLEPQLYAIWRSNLK